MSQPIDREGVFRGDIIEYGVKEYQSNSIAVSIRVAIKQFWNSHQDVPAWEDWEQFDFEAFGYIIVIKKDGTTNKLGVESLCQHANWDASFDSIQRGVWKPTPCQFVVKPNEYQGQTTYRVEFINDYERVPGGTMGTIDEAKAKDLQNRFGSSLRAIGSSVKRNAAPAEGKPTAPPKRNPVAANNKPVASDDEPPF